MNKKEQSKFNKKSTNDDSLCGRANKGLSHDSEGSKEPTDATSVVEKRKRVTLLHVIFILELAFMVSILSKSSRDDVLSSPAETAALSAVPLLQSFWMTGVSYFGYKRQFFVTEQMQRSMPMVWLPLVMLVTQSAIFMGCWDSTKAILDNTPRAAFVGLQCIRVLALGSLVKWKLGIFPAAFAWCTAFPDMVFGLSAIVLLIEGDWINDDWFLAVWNLVGFTIIAPVGVLVVQLGMEPTQWYNSTVPNYIVFAYPMVLGPAVVVPILLSWNAVVAVWAFSRLV